MKLHFKTSRGDPDVDRGVSRRDSAAGCGFEFPNLSD
jgi:hypothetical protein